MFANSLSWFDWAIVASFLVIAAVTVMVANRFMRSVADFLAAGRCAGRYLLTVAGMAMGAGAISAVQNWESTYKVGYGPMWWNNLQAPVYLILTLSAWVGYRYRQTRSLTLAQFFEVRYSRRFRVFAGLLAYVSGVLNYGIFPAIAARFMLYFCGFQEYPITFHLPLLGTCQFQVVFASILLFMTVFSLFITLGGGQVGIMVSDFIQGMLFLIVGVVLAIWCVRAFHWSEIGTAALNADTTGNKSMINPFKGSQVKDFNMWYWMITAFNIFYNPLAWQGASGFAAAPKSAHEGRMAGMIGTWRNGALWVILSFLALCAFAVMHTPKHAFIAGKVQDEINAIANPNYQSQAIVPIVLRHVLPLGLMGLLVAVLLTGAVTTDDTYLHSWGSIFIQDVIMPFRKKALDPKTHIRFLRWSIAGVAIFAFFFSLLFHQSLPILMYFAITGALFLGGAGAVIIGGLYWKRGATAGAWTAMIAGTVTALTGAIMGYTAYARTTLHINVPGAVSVTVNDADAWPVGDHWEYRFPLMRRGEWESVHVVAEMPAGHEERTVYHAYAETPTLEPAKAAAAPSRIIAVTPGDRYIEPMGTGTATQVFVALRSINGQWWLAISMGISIVCYVVVSLLSGQVCDMDKLLHRGKYAIKSDQAIGDGEVKRSFLRSFFGITPEFTRRDKFIYFLTFGWSMFWILNFLVLLLLNLKRVGGDSWLAHVQSDQFWVKYFEYKFYVELGAGILATVWLCCGGAYDLVDLFRTLSTATRNDADDGRVLDHQNAGEEEPKPAAIDHAFEVLPPPAAPEPRNE